MDAARTDAPGAHRALRALLALLPGAAAARAGWPVLGNGLSGDDFTHLLELANVGPRDFLTAPYGGHMLFVRNLVFYGCFRAFGTDPLGYFAAALATHVAASLLVGMLARRLTGDGLVACLAGVLFAVAPSSHGTLGWYSVHGHAIAAVAVLAGLLAIAPRPGSAAPLAPRAAGWAAGAMLVASQSFGTGAAVAMVFPAVAAVLRPGSLRLPRTRAVLLGTPVAVLVAWVVMNSLRTRLNPAGVEATLTLAKLASDVRLVGLVTIDLAGMGIHDLLLGAPVALAEFGNAVSLAAVAGFVAVLAAALALGAASSRRALLACLVAAGACYLSVAAGRATGYLVFSRGRLLEMLAMATRYHYLAQSLLAVALAVALDALRRRLPWSPRVTAAPLAAWLLWALLQPLWFPPREPPRGHRERAQIARARAGMEEAVRRQPPGATVCLPVEPVPIAFAFPGSVGVFVLYYPGDELEGRRVRFVSSDPAVLALRAGGGRMGALLLPEGGCPPATEVAG